MKMQLTLDGQMDRKKERKTLLMLTRLRSYKNKMIKFSQKIYRIICLTITVSYQK